MQTWIWVCEWIMSSLYLVSVCYSSHQLNLLEPNSAWHIFQEMEMVIEMKNFELDHLDHLDEFSWICSNNHVQKK